MKKTIISIAAIVFAATALTACGGSDSTAETTAAETTAAETTAAAETEAASDDEGDAEEETDAALGDEEDELGAAVQELANALDGTLWVGMDTEFNCYALGFDGTSTVFAADDGSSIEGYWAVDDTTLYIYEDEEMTSELAEIGWNFDQETETLILNDSAVMAQTDAYSFDEAVEAVSQMASAAQVASYLQDTYWVSITDEDAEAMYLSGSTLESITVSPDGSAETNDFVWGLDYDSLYLYDETGTDLIAALGWAIADDGSVIQLDNDGDTREYTQLSEEDATDVMSYLLAALNADAE